MPKLYKQMMNFIYFNWSRMVCFDIFFQDDECVTRFSNNVVYISEKN